MILNNGYDTKAGNQYRKDATFRSTPEELTLMLYNGIIKFIMQAQAAVENNDIKKAHDSIIRAEDIISELRSTLDMNYEISKNLLLLYDYMHRRLIEANIKKDMDILEEVLGLAKDLRDIWVQAVKIVKKQYKAREA